MNWRIKTDGCTQPKIGRRLPFLIPIYWVWIGMPIELVVFFNFNKAILGWYCKISNNSRLYYLLIVSSGHRYCSQYITVTTNQYWADNWPCKSIKVHNCECQIRGCVISHTRKLIKPIPVGAPTKTQVCGCSIVGNAVSNPVWGMDVFLQKGVRCQVEISASALSLVQRSPTECVCAWIIAFDRAQQQQ